MLILGKKRGSEQGRAAAGKGDTSDGTLSSCAHLCNFFKCIIDCIGCSSGEMCLWCPGRRKKPQTISFLKNKSLARFPQYMWSYISIEGVNPGLKGGGLMLAKQHSTWRVKLEVVQEGRKGFLPTR